MPHAGNKIADTEQAWAISLELLLHLQYADRRQADVLAEAVENETAKTQAQNVANGDAADASAEPGQKRQPEMQATAVNQIAAEGEQGFIGHGQTDNAQHQQREKRGIAVMCDPGKNAVHCCYDSVMAKPKNSMFEVACPCCGATLHIDPETQVVIHHKEAERKPLIEDLQVAVQQLKGEEAKRNEAFEKSFASHKSADKVREKKFDELLKLAKEDKTEGPPKRLFDLD